MTTYTGWHWSAGLTLGNGDGRAIAPRGRWQRAKLSKGETPDLCTRGMHASPTALGALRYARGLHVARVELRGAIFKGDDKAVARERRDTTRRVDATQVVLGWLEECVVPMAQKCAAKCAANAAHAADATGAAWYAADAAMCAAYAAYAADVADAAGAAWYAADAAKYAAYAAGYAANTAWNAAHAAMNADLEHRLDELLHLTPPMAG